MSLPEPVKDVVAGTALVAGLGAAILGIIWLVDHRVLWPVWVFGALVLVCILGTIGHGIRGEWRDDG